MKTNNVLGEYFSQATKNFSNVSRTWEFTIMAATLAFMFKVDNNPSMHCFLLIIVILAILCILLDGIQYFYTAAKVKSLLDKTAEQKNSEKCQVVDHNDDNRKTLTERDIKEAMYFIHNNTFKSVIAKFCLLTVSTLLLSLFILIIAK